MFRKNINDLLFFERGEQKKAHVDLNIHLNQLS